MKGLAAILMVAGALSLSTAKAGVLNVRQIYQIETEWCWAASCQAVLEFYGLVQTQTNLANYGTGGANVWNYLWGSGMEPDGIFRRGCDLILNQFGSVAGSGLTGYLTAIQLQNEINAARPVIINWEWNAGGGHILVARGMVSNNVYLMDPWYGPSIDDYNWVRTGDGHSWEWTLQLSTASLATNGVPRWWLGIYGLTNNWNAAALADQDADHVTTWEEYVADTNPTNANSYFRAGLQAAANGQIAIAWQSSSNRLYTLQIQTNAISQPGWGNVTGCIQTNGRGGTMSVTNLPAADSSCYRLLVATPP
ncbi:MAG TPA: hypothetical protein DCZ95_15340 [Verrucomicrobia bacterium]|nr:MAG: hypothetical protein A2X46_19095 [Lentisphaerae bacterium GWF2_57_35]HBA85459.1 hypothetical protein [Verrucomicrobiota bacterium]